MADAIHIIRHRSRPARGMTSRSVLFGGTALTCHSELVSLVVFASLALILFANVWTRLRSLSFLSGLTPATPGFKLGAV